MFSSAYKGLAAVLIVLWTQFGFAAVATPVKDLVKPASVVFLNPGYSNEEFWLSYIGFMQAAADDLGMRLSVVHGERDRKRLLAEAGRLLRSPEQTDYVLFVNELGLAPDLVKMFNGSSIKLMSLHSTLTAGQQTFMGGTRERYRNWIGSLVPNDEEAGYLTAKALITKLGGHAGQLLAFAGMRHAPNSNLREAGLKRALQEHPEIKLLQLVYGEWSRTRAYEQAKILLARYEQAQLVWSVNDQMAFGAMQAAQELGRTPGEDIWLSGFNNSNEVLEARISGRLSALASGHFTLGGWAMVMIHDYHAGKDFAGYGGKDRVDHVFSVLSSLQASRLKARLSQPGYGLDFRQFSTVYHDEIENYRFSMAPMLE